MYGNRRIHIIRSNSLQRPGYASSDKTADICTSSHSYFNQAKHSHERLCIQTNYFCIQNMYQTWTTLLAEKLTKQTPLQAK